MNRASNSIPIVLFGGSGMLGGEFVRLLESHPSLHLAVAATREGGSLADSQPHCIDIAPAVPFDVAESTLSDLATRGPVAAVYALPHGESAKRWRSLRQTLAGSALGNVRVVDLAADYRLRDLDEYARVYGHAHPDPEGLEQFVYGLPELTEAIDVKARCVAAAGCFATAMQLATVPAASGGILDASRPVVLSGITGSSGSGNTPAPNTHHPFRAGNLWAYSAKGHRHEAELAQALRAHGVAPEIQFVAHSGPFVRGIHLTAFLPLSAGVDLAAAQAVYERTFRGRPFVEVLAGKLPDLRRVVGGNRACLGISLRGSLLTVCVAIDNIVKGGAGQGLQCLNRMFGLPENLGLPRMGLGVNG